jgi:dual specificity phosphatase 12
MPLEDSEEGVQTWEEFGHKFEAGELESLKQSIADMALSRIDGEDNLYVGG